MAKMWVFDAVTNKWQSLGGGGSSAGGDHGSLTGLYDDDHPHYLTTPRGDARYSLTTHLHDPVYLRPENVIAGPNVTVVTDAIAGTVTISSSGGGGTGPAGTDEVQVSTIPPTLPEVELWVDSDASGTFQSVPDPNAATDHGTLTGLADNDHPQYVLITGSTMSGGLILAGMDGVSHTPPTGAAQITVGSVDGTAYFDTRAAATKGQGITMRTGVEMRWAIGTDVVGETGGNSGTNLILTRYDDNGARIDDTLTISRATGRVSVAQAPVDPGDVVTKGYADARVSDEDLTVAVPLADVAPSQQAIKEYVDNKMIVSDNPASGTHAVNTIWIEY